MLSLSQRWHCCVPADSMHPFCKRRGSGLVARTDLYDGLKWHKPLISCTSHMPSGPCAALGLGSGYRAQARIAWFPPRFRKGRRDASVDFAAGVCRVMNGQSPVWKKPKQSLDGNLLYPVEAGSGQVQSADVGNRPGLLVRDAVGCCGSQIANSQVPHTRSECRASSEPMCGVCGE